MKQEPPTQRPAERTIDPLTAIGALIALVAATALVTYGALIIPSRIRAADGPPEEFRLAATQQALQSAQGTPTISSPGDDQLTNTPDIVLAGSTDSFTDRAASTPAGTANPYGDWPIPSNMDADYWLSIPAIGVEAPIIGFSPRERQVDGATVLRLPVPNFYGVSWDVRSTEPGFAGNTVLTGHSNLYGGVFGDLDLLAYGNEIAVWSQYGVFSYYVSQIEYIPDKDQPLEVRIENAAWMLPTPDDRLTLITCWPATHSTHRLIVIATR